MQTHRRSMFLYLCLIWDLGGGVPKVCLSTRGGEVVQNRGFRFRSSPPSGMREGGRGGGGRDCAPTYPEVRTDGEGGGRKRRRCPFRSSDPSAHATGNRPADSGRRRPRGNSDAPGQHGNSYSLIIRVRTLPRARKISG